MAICTDMLTGGIWLPIMRIETSVRLFGYPALALVMFLMAAALGVGIVVSALLRDRRARPREESGPR